MRCCSKATIPPEHQPDATLTQAAPVQNTWYPILNTTKNCRIYRIFVSVADTNETLEVKITIDGNIISGSVPATAGTSYYVYFSGYGNALIIDTVDPIAAYAFLLEGRSIKVEVRKTTAAGAGTITARVKYAKW